MNSTPSPMIAAPATPSSTPITRCVVSRSSRNDAITKAVNSGVMAFMMDASPTLTMICPAFRELNGSPLLRLGSPSSPERRTPKAETSEARTLCERLRREMAFGPRAGLGRT